MKQVLFIAFMILGLTVSYSLAQMGHGMMRGGHMTDQNGHMMNDKGMGSDQGFKQMDDILTRKEKLSNEMPMHHRQMMSGLMGATQDIAIMMRQMSVMMGGITDIDDKASGQALQSMSEMMSYMAIEMNRMSKMMSKTTATDDEVRDMQNRIIRMQEQLLMIKR